MEKEIPISQEKSGRAGRLREACARLQALPLDRKISDAEWESATGELTNDDFEALKRLAGSYRDRAIEPSNAEAERLEEATASILLWPRDPEWTKATADAYRKAGWKGSEAEGFFAALARRTGRKRTKTRGKWVWTAAIFLGLVPAAVLVVALTSGINRASGVSTVQGPRNLEAVFDTQGVKTNIQVSESRLILFPDATVAEISAWITFPDHRVDLWEGQVTVLDADGQALTTRDLTFRASSDGPLEPGQGVEIFQQFNAHPFYDKVSSFQVTTSRILAQEAHPQDRKPLEFQGAETLAAGYQLRVWIQQDQWVDRFASKVHTLSLEFENAGLKPFADLQMALVWKDNLGKTLKTLVFRPVSAFRTALPPGARLPWTQETVFDTEVFSWPEGQPPHPVLELRAWQ